MTLKKATFNGYFETHICPTYPVHVVHEKVCNDA